MQKHKKCGCPQSNVFEMCLKCVRCLIINAVHFGVKLAAFGGLYCSAMNDITKWK